MNMTESWARRVLVLLCLLGACRALADLPPAPAAAAGSEAIPVTPPEPVIFPLPPPVIWLAPHANTSLDFNVAVGSQFTCRWLHNGRPLAGAAGTRLDITDGTLDLAYKDSGEIAKAINEELAYLNVSGLGEGLPGLDEDEWVALDDDEDEWEDDGGHI